MVVVQHLLHEIIVLFLYLRVWQRAVKWVFLAYPLLVSTCVLGQQKHIGATQLSLKPMCPFSVCSAVYL